MQRLSFEFCRRKNQPSSFPRCRFEAGHGRTRVQSGPAAKRHHRKIRRLFLRGSPAKSKRKPLHHVLRTAGTLPTVSGRAFLTARVEQRPMERGQNAEVGGQGEPNSRLERAESRGQRSGGTGQPEQPFNARGARDAKGTGILLFYLKPATWNLKPCGEVRGQNSGKAPKGGKGFSLKPGTWNLKPKRTASALGERSYRTAGTAFRRRDAAGPLWKPEQPHGRTRTVGGFRLKVEG